MSRLIPLLLSLAVLAALALIGGGAYLAARRPADRQRGLLMLLAGAVTLLNIWLWATMPGSS